MSGKVVDKLEEHALRENTIVIFMSDNGHSEETGNRIRVANHKSGLPEGHFYGASGGGSTGKWTGHKGTFLEGGIRVPGLIVWPGKITKPLETNFRASTSDIMPTIIDVLGIQQETLEFDSDNLGVLDLSWDDVRRLRTHRPRGLVVGDEGHALALDVSDDAEQVEQHQPRFARRPRHGGEQFRGRGIAVRHA